MNKLLMIFLMVCFCLVNCSKAGRMVDTPSDPSPIKLTLSESNIYVDGNETITIAIGIENYNQLKELKIGKKVGLKIEWKKLAVSEIEAQFEFTYTLTNNDGDLLDFVFSAVAKNGNIQDTKVLHIESKNGLNPYNLTRIARVTGKSLQSENLPNPNHTAQLYDVGGTDLGIMWEMGNGDVGIFFGDTNGQAFSPSPNGGGNGGNWRSNVLAFSKDTNLLEGLEFYDMATVGSSSVAREIISSEHITDGTGSFTSIPTAAIHANGAEYVHFMDVREWGVPGEWETNFSGLFTSTDNGKNWQVCPEVRFSAESNFAQVSYAKKDGYVYMLGTVSGRFGAAYLARFAEADILKPADYEYWNLTGGWVKGTEKSASPLFNGPVGELSLAYNSKYKRWIATYLNSNRAEIVLRYSNNVNGPWSVEKTLVSAANYPGLYGAFIHPLKNKGDELYFLMSLWYPYNVFLMKAQLK